MSNIKLLLVDDSIIILNSLKTYFKSQQGYEVVGAASDPYQAREILAEKKVDLIILDMFLPKMDGLTFLKHLMKSYPVPVVVYSSKAYKDKKLHKVILDAGAFRVVPKTDLNNNDVENFTRLKDAVKSCYLSNIGKSYRFLTLIGASTGGPPAVEAVVKELYPGISPVVIVLHMPEHFTEQFARRLNSLSAVRVKEAEACEILEAGTVYIAKGGVHLQIKDKNNGDLYFSFDHGEKVKGQRPAVDKLFESAAKLKNLSRLTAIIMTGMGSDGTSGSALLKEKGARIICQDEKSCVVYGMPAAAVAAGLADKIVHLNDLHKFIY